MDDLYTAQEAGEALGISDRQIRRRAAQGQIEKVKKGAKVFYRLTQEDIQADTSGNVQTPAQTRQEMSDNQFMIVRDAHQSQTAIVRRLDEEIRTAKEGRQVIEKSKAKWQAWALTAIVASIVMGSLVIIIDQARRGGLDNVASLSATIDTMATDKAANKATSRKDIEYLQNQLDQASSRAGRLAVKADKMTDDATGYIMLLNAAHGEIDRLRNEIRALQEVKPTDNTELNDFDIE